MSPVMTKHAKVRMQQRAIPPFVEQLLDEFGEQQFDGHGGVICYFSKDSRRRMEQVMGRDPVRVLERYFDYIKVESSRDGTLITIAPRLCRIRRP